MQKRTGISLIVLVITIIVMVILAGAIILTLNNSGIIDEATDAVEQSNLATVKELTQMAWAEAYAGGERTEEGLKAAVDKALSDNKVDTSKYVIEVTTSGVTVELKNQAVATEWRQEGLTVTNGIQTAEIGDVVNYVSGVETTAFNRKTDAIEKNKYENIGSWQILGVENNQLLLVSSQSVVDEGDGGIDLTDYELTRFNTICAEYGEGEYATGARLIKVEDVNRVTGYNPLNVGVYDPTQTGRGVIYEQGTDNEYGQTVTYEIIDINYDEWEVAGVIEYTIEYNGLNGLKGTFKTTNVEEAFNEEEYPYTKTNESYRYWPTTLTSNKQDAENGIATDSKAYKMLFENGDIWLGDYVVRSEDSMECVYVISSTCILPAELENYVCTGVFMGLRPVVTLETDIKLISNGTNSWLLSK